MIFDYGGLILTVIGILGGFVFWKIIKYYNYELSFNENLLSFIPTFTVIYCCLVDHYFLKIKFDLVLIIIISIYFLALILLYYIVRFIKLKKYVPSIIIVSYVLISFVTLIIVGNALNNTSNIDGWGAIGFGIIYISLYGSFNMLLLLFNILVFVIKLLSKNNNDYKNVNYRLSKFSFINILILLLIIGFIFWIDYYNEYNYNKLIREQTSIVKDYLKQEYSNYDFEIIDVYETKNNCDFMVCTIDVFRNEIIDNSSDEIFIIDVKKEDLTIYEDEFKEMVENE